MNVCQQKQNASCPGRIRVVFLAINSSYSHRSLAAWCLQSMLDEERVEWHLVEGSINDDPELVVQRVLAHQPDVVAATLYLFTTEYVQQIFRQLRSCRKGCVFAVGGPECLGDNRHLVPAIADVAFRGEGEVVFAEWLRLFRRPERWSGITGLCGRSGEEYYDNGTAEEVGTLDEIPAFYPRMLEARRLPFVQLETARGCPNGCVFCTSRKTRLRHKGMERVCQDLAAIHSAGIRDVRLVDRTFNVNGRRALQWLERFRLSYADTRFHLEIDPALLTDPIVEAFRVAPAGQLHLEMGVQSLEPAVCPLLERKGRPEDVIDWVRKVCQLNGVGVHVDLIAGLPGQTLNGLLQDILALIQAGPAEIQLERLKLLPGTPLAMEPQRWGLQCGAVPPYAVLATQTMTADDLVIADQASKILDWFHNKPALQGVFREGVRRHPGSFRELLAHCAGVCSFSVCPSLADRLRIFDSFWKVRDAIILQRVRYLWYRSGLSIRDGLCSSEPWKRPIPDSAVLVEGMPGQDIARTWRVILDVPHYFCFGRGPAGGRALMAVFREC